MTYVLELSFQVMCCVNHVRTWFSMLELFGLLNWV